MRGGQNIPIQQCNNRKSNIISLCNYKLAFFSSPVEEFVVLPYFFLPQVPPPFVSYSRSRGGEVAALPRSTLVRHSIVGHRTTQNATSTYIEGYFVFCYGPLQQRVQKDHTKKSHGKKKN